MSVPEKAIKYHTLANTQMMEHKYNDAVQNYLKAIETAPDYDSAYFHLAEAYEKKKLDDKAFEAYIKAIDLNSNHAESYIASGLDSLLTGPLGRAVADYKKTRKPSPVAPSQQTSQSASSSHQTKTHADKVLAETTKQLHAKPSPTHQPSASASNIKHIRHVTVMPEDSKFPAGKEVEFLIELRDQDMNIIPEAMAKIDFYVKPPLQTDWKKQQTAEIKANKDALASYNVILPTPLHTSCKLEISDKDGRFSHPNEFDIIAGDVATVAFSPSEKILSQGEKIELKIILLDKFNNPVEGEFVSVALKEQKGGNWILEGSDTTMTGKNGSIIVSIQSPNKSGSVVTVGVSTSQRSVTDLPSVKFFTEGVPVESITDDKIATVNPSAAASNKSLDYITSVLEPTDTKYEFLDIGEDQESSQSEKFDEQIFKQSGGDNVGGNFTEKENKGKVHVSNNALSQLDALDFESDIISPDVKDKDNFDTLDTAKFIPIEHGDAIPDTPVEIENFSVLDSVLDIEQAAEPQSHKNTEKLANGEWRMASENPNNQQLTTNNHLQTSETAEPQNHLSASQTRQAGKVTKVEMEEFSDMNELPNGNFSEKKQSFSLDEIENILTDESSVESHVKDITVNEMQFQPISGTESGGTLESSSESLLDFSSKSVQNLESSPEPIKPQEFVSVSEPAFMPLPVEIEKQQKPMSDIYGREPSEQPQTVVPANNDKLVLDTVPQQQPQIFDFQPSFFNVEEDEKQSASSQSNSPISDTQNFNSEVLISAPMVPANAVSETSPFRSVEASPPPPPKFFKEPDIETLIAQEPAVTSFQRQQSNQPMAFSENYFNTPSQQQPPQNSYTPDPPPKSSLERGLRNVSDPEYQHTEDILNYNYDVSSNNPKEPIDFYGDYENPSSNNNPDDDLDDIISNTPQPLVVPPNPYTQPTFYIKRGKKPIVRVDSILPKLSKLAIIVAIFVLIAGGIYFSYKKIYFEYEYMKGVNAFLNFKAYESALQHFIICTELLPDNVKSYVHIKQIHFELAELSKKKGDFNTEKQHFISAITALDKTLSIEPNNMDALFDKGFAYESMGNKIQAEVIYKQVLQKDPNYTMAKDRLDNLKSTIGQ